MAYTLEDIQEKLANKIDYTEIIRLLELDLNTIAMEVIDDPEDYIEFKVFFDFDEFDTTISLQAPGEGNGLYITPVMVNLVGGSYSTEKGPQVYQTEFRIEVFGFSKDAENLRTILEVYSSLNQGAVTNGVFGNALTTSVTDFPVITEPAQYKGFERVSLFLSWLLTFIYSGQLANDVIIELDDEEINLLALNIKRNRVGNSIQRNDEEEVSTLNQSQMLVFTGGFVYDGSDVAAKVLRNIKNKDQGLNENFDLKITYSNIVSPDIDTITGYEWVSITGPVAYDVSNKYFGNSSDLVLSDPIITSTNAILEDFDLVYVGTGAPTSYDATLTVVEGYGEPEIFKAIHDQISSWHDTPSLPATFRVDDGLGYSEWTAVANAESSKSYYVSEAIIETTYGTAEVDVYNAVVTEGDIQITQGGYLTLNFSMALT